MKKIILFLALLSLGVSKAQVVGGYLPLNSTKSFTAGNSTFSNVIARGTLSVGSTATLSGNALFSSSVGIGSLPTSSLSSFRVVKGTGTVDIGSTANLGSIWLNQTTPSSSNWQIFGDGSNTYYNTTSSGAHIFGVNNSSGLFQVNASSNYMLRPVTIGATTAPTATLDVNGTVKVSSTFSLGSANLTGGNTGTVAVLSDVPFIVYLNGNNSAGTISDATTYYISGTGFILSSNTSATDGQVLIPWNCTLIGYSFNNRVNGTTATSETSTLSLRVDNTTDITLSSAITFSANQSNFTSSALSSTIASGSLISAKIVTPTWATNPSNIFTGLYLYFTRRL